MRVRLDRSGGFANIRRSFTADTKAMPQVQVEELRRLVEAVDLSHFPEEPTPRPGRPDRFYYRVTIEHEKAERSITVAEDSAPEALQRLIDWVLRLAQG
jgi:Emfourin